MKRTTLRATAGRVAVAGTAALAALVSVAPPTFADDLAPETEETNAPASDPAPETETAPEPTPAPETAPAPEEKTETPVEDTPDESTSEDTGDESTSEEETDGASDPAPRLETQEVVEAPGVAADDGVSVDQDSTTAIDVLDNDDTSDGVQQINVQSSPQHGTAEVIGDGLSSRILYTPNDGFTGTDQLTYSFTGSTGLESNVGTVVITVDELAYVDQTYTIGAQTAGYVDAEASTSGSTYQIALTGPDGSTTYDWCTADLAGDETANYCSDLDGLPELILTRLAAPSGATLTLPAGFKAVITQTSVDGNYLQRSEESFTIGRTTTEGSSTDVLFTNYGFVPSVGNASYSNVSATEPTDIHVLEDDIVGDPSTTITITGQPEDGTASIITPVRTGDPNARAAGEPPFIRFTPDEDQPGGTQIITYTATNSNGTSAERTITLQVEGELAPNYGTQKFYVGVQVADGSWVPEGTTVDGATFSITYTIDGETVGTESCEAVAYEDDPLSGECDDEFEAPPGATVRVVQTSAPANLTVDPDAIVLPPCENPGLGGYCYPDEDPLFIDLGPVPETTPDTATTDFEESVDVDVLANDPVGDPEVYLSVGSNPSNGTAEIIGEAAEVEDSTPDDGDDDDGEDLPSLCDVLPVPGCEDGSLDDFICFIVPLPGCFNFPGPIQLSKPVTAFSPVSSLAAAQPIRAFKAAGAGTQAVRYTPDEGFSGVDTFSVRVENTNGSALETLSVTVRDGVVIDDDSVAGDDTVVSDDQALPDTGGSDARWLALGAVLTAAGGVIVSRRRRTAAAE